jgi:excisionase family DNA binding protein
MVQMPRPIAFPATSPAADEDLVSLKDAARRLGLRPDTLKKMAQRGEIASVKYRKLRLFEPRALRAFIDQHRVGGDERAL